MTKYRLSRVASDSERIIYQRIGKKDDEYGKKYFEVVGGVTTGKEFSSISQVRVYMKIMALKYAA